MAIKAIIDINLSISGPLLCSGTSSLAWGVDKTFDRDYLGRPYIDRSHFKGKLREAFEELNLPYTDVLFGKEGDWNNGLLYFSDFRLVDSNLESQLKTPSEKKLTRIKINPRGVVETGALAVLENPFPGCLEPSGKEKCYEWIGRIEYIISDDSSGGEEKRASEVYKNILIALKWITAFGSEKSIGFGRLQMINAQLRTEKIDISDLIKKEKQQATISKSNNIFTLSIEAQEPLLLGDLKIETNYQETRDYISGAMVKAALAQTLNILSGVNKPAITPVNGTGRVSKVFPILAKYFSRIRFTHAYPSLENNKRPAAIPFSVIKLGNRHVDVCWHEVPPDNLEAVPVFQIDWKDDDFPAGFDWAFLRRFYKTRTAIDDELRRADEGSLFTYQYVCPEDENGHKIYWVGGVYLDSIDPGDIPDLVSELKVALKFMNYIGKRAGRIKAQLYEGEPEPYKKDSIQFINDRVIIVLQSDALMINPFDLLEKQTGEKLKELYDNYWKDVSDNSLSLSHFFARQKLRAPYRFKTGMDKEYYPFFLTEAGSVFVLKVDKKDEVNSLLTNWKQRGLPIPGWARKKYGEEVWKQCPYVPENGYGEVLINPDLGIPFLNNQG